VEPSDESKPLNRDPRYEGTTSCVVEASPAGSARGGVNKGQRRARSAIGPADVGRHASGRAL